MKTTKGNKMNNWIKWKGGACPVDGSVVVDIAVDNVDGIESGPAEYFNWGTDSEWIISSYRVVEAKPAKSDGSTASYYELPEGVTELQHLISHRNMNSQIGEIFRACYRYGLVEHSAMLRDAKKIAFYAQAEIERLEKLV
tara:strand:+ start:73 stop:492 length:420 start_codon:yes stop_codon:yes gene_type:complete